ncbi:restriction endonuclease subunit S domain-containing protein [Methanobrevibacter filiformis]|uniref:EcoKI restriction-modification system protein HsdS n=1 Tax=Methanobrevibacter filiformis TaxID=55758 RepID=A0A165ZEL7_9EURY|nr:hypothetical protein [Methanobrevibacter filiformis]KZX10613.1 EcoKI restriction-modification system protein HsdS [Methanobrevibacter filiformis]
MISKHHKKTKKEEYLKLGQIADIYSGVVLSRIKSNNPNEDSHKYHVITKKAVNNNFMDTSQFEEIYTNKEIDDKFIAKDKTLVMKLTPPYSLSIIAFHREDVIIPSNFAIIHVNNEFDEFYLSYVLNSNNLRKQIIKLVEGTPFPVIKLDYLNDIKIKKIGISKQIHYSKLFSLLNKRKNLLKRKLEIEENIIKLTIDSLS